MKSFLVSTITMLAVASMQAQNTILQKVNDIKRQSDVYYFDQYAHPNPDTARANVMQWLLADVNGERPETDMLQVEDIAPKVQHLVMKSATLTRDFAYIRKDDVPSASATKRGTETTAGTVTVTQTTATPLTPQPSASMKFVPDLFVQKIIELDNFTSVYRYLRALKAERQLQLFGRLSQVEDYRSLELIIFDIKTQKVITLLSAQGPNGSRTNLTTGTADSLSNYPEEMVAVIWYIK